MKHLLITIISSLFLVIITFLNDTIRMNVFLKIESLSSIWDWMVFVFVSREFSGELSECDEGVLKWIPFRRRCLLVARCPITAP